MKPIAVVLFAMLSNLFAGSSYALGAESGEILKVQIPDLPPSFRDVSIELRCNALSRFVESFAKQYLSELGYREIGCSEGNGIGGANYVLEFKFKSVQEIKAYSIQISLNGNAPHTKVCLHAAPDTYCSKEYAEAPAPSDPHFITNGDEKAAESVNRNYVQPSLRLNKLMPTVAAWVSGQQQFSRIFGGDFQTFVGSMLNKQLELPVPLKNKNEILKLELTPSKQGTTGKVKLLSEIPAGQRSCLGCSDGLCKEVELTYSFNNRFFAIASTPKAENASSDSHKAKFGLAWVMDGPQPILNGQPNWRFFCGVSRYSVQVIKTNF